MRIFAPAIVLLDRLHYSFKFALIGIVMSIPIFYSCYAIVNRASDDVATARAERAGLDVLDLVNQYLRHIQQHDAATIAVRAGRMSQDELSALQQKCDHDIQAVDAAAKQSSLEITAQWQALATKYSASINSGSAEESGRIHAELSEDTLKVIEHLGNTSGLILDPESATYHLAFVALDTLPRISTDLARLRVSGLNSIAKHVLQAEDRKALQDETARISRLLTKTRDNLNLALEAQPTIKASLEPAIVKVQGGVAAFLTLINERIAASAESSIDVAEFDRVGDSAARNCFSLSDAILTPFRQLLDDRVSATLWTRNVTLSVDLGAFLIAAYLFIGLYLALHFAVDRILAAVTAAVSGDLTWRLKLSGSDAIGQLGQGFDQLIQSFDSNIALIARNAGTMAVSAEEMSSTARQMAANSVETSGKAGKVSASAGLVNRNLQSVMTASEHMTLAIKEISSNTSQSAHIAATAFQSAVATQKTVAKLQESSKGIGNVVNVINQIANQTNLLALNATIEAARAGVSGKGFAVVASEVKDLAKETAKATEDIVQRIEAIQADAKLAVDAIAKIGQVIEQVNGMSNSIASAVEEQAASTTEISRHVSDAARGAGSIVQNIENVAKAAQETSQGAANSEKASMNVQEMAAILQQFVSQFKCSAQVGTESFAPKLATPVFSADFPFNARTAESRLPARNLNAEYVN